MVRWPGVTRAGAVDDRHLISAVDLLPTLLDIVGLPHPPGMDGRSFAPILRGGNQDGRDHIVAEYNENSGGHRHPMRAIITRDHGYLFNPWSNGTRAMATATKGTATYRRMVALAPDDPALNARLRLFEHRVPEELYDYARDPDALRNLIDDPVHRAKRDELTARLEAWMVRTKDPMLPVFRARTDPAAREAFMREQEAEAAGRGGAKRPGKTGKRKAGGGQEP
jgi:N-sulfoglucosamine sulfohydrolase